MRRDLQLKDAKGVDCLPNATIFEQLTLMGYEKLSQKLTFYKAFFSPQWKILIHMILQCLSAKTTAWNEFSSTIASAIICKFFMYPKFIQVFLEKQLEEVPTHNRIYNVPSHTKKIFRNMKRVGKDFSRRVTPLFPTMMIQNQADVGEADDAINEEMDDSLATPNEAGSLGTTSGGGTKRQDTIRDTIAQTRLQLKELMELCTNLQQRVLDLENAKNAQAQEITSLKLRVKRLEKKRVSRTHKLKRLYRVGSSRRVESSEDEGLGNQEDVSKQWRKIANIDVDEGITLVDDTQERYGDDMFDTGVLDDEEVFKGQDVDETRNVAEEEVNTTDPVTTASGVVIIASVEVPVVKQELEKGTTTTTTTAATIIIAASTRPKVKAIIIQEQVQAPTPTVSSQQSSHVKDKGKAKMVEPKPVKKMSKKDQIMLDEELALKLQAKEEEEERLAREIAQQVEEVNISWDNMQAMIDVDYQMAQRVEAQEQEELSIEE
ncbi:hypothetical protein Tco_1259713 [Tanacetum coccineum]